MEASPADGVRPGVAVVLADLGETPLSDAAGLGSAMARRRLRLAVEALTALGVLTAHDGRYTFAVDVAANETFRVPSESATFGQLPVDLTTSPLGYFGIATEITSRINFLVNSGDALILAEHAPEVVSIDRVIRMLLIHDIVVKPFTVDEIILKVDDALQA